MKRFQRRQVPSFSLYGESARGALTEALHCETIQSRSRKYLWRIGNHRHVGLCQCIFVATGPVAVDLEDAHHRQLGPSVFIIPAGAVHGFRFGADTQGYVLTMDLDRLLGAAKAQPVAPIAALFSTPRCVDLEELPEIAARLQGLFSTLLTEFQQPESLTVPVSGWLGCAVLWVLASLSPQATAPQETAEPQDFERLRRFRALIETNYRHHWPVRRYARQLGLSESSLNRLCLSLAGSTAFDVVQQRLILEARRRLVYVAGPIAMIAAELGFKDPAYFCRFFRKRTGLAPSAFRRRQVDG